MRVGINEVLLYPQTSGAVNRELTLLPELMRALVGSGIEPVVYFSRDADDELIERVGAGMEGVRAVRTPLPALPTSRRVIAGLTYWPRRALEDRLDLFQTSYHPAPRLGVPTLLVVHDVRLARMPETYHWARRIFLKAVLPFSLRAASKIVTGSADTKRDLISLFRVPEEKIAVCPIPLSAGFERVEDHGLLESVRERYRLPERYILNVSKIEPRKNIERLVEAHREVTKSFDVGLVVVGTPDPAFRGLYEKLQSEGERSGVRFTGFVEDRDLPALYSMASVFAYPSIHEGFGIPLLEAMACGVPIVTSNRSALPEVAGDAALLVDPFEAGSISRAIERLLGEPDLAAELVERGYQRVTRFSPRAAAEQIVMIYKGLLFRPDDVD